MSEKRKFTRVTIKSVAEVILLNEEFDQAYVGGISRGGLEIYTHIEMKKNEIYRVRLHFFFQGQEVTETVEGTVKWSASFKNAFVSGMEFTQVLNDSEHGNLLHFIEQAERYYK